jgi:hypothetical protein
VTNCKRLLRSTAPPRDGALSIVEDGQVRANAITKGKEEQISGTHAPTLTQDQIEALSPYGEMRKTDVGQVLIRAGDISSDFIVLLEGEVEVIDSFAGEARTMGVLGAGSFVGELNMLTGQALYLSVVVRTGGKVLAIRREQLKEVVTEHPSLSDTILKVFLARRSMGRPGVRRAPTARSRRPRPGTPCTMPRPPTRRPPKS